MNSTLLQNLGRGSIGMFFLIFVCFLLSTNRKAINWKLVLFGILAQIMFAMGVLHTTVADQPVFWILFGVILVYTIIRKFKNASNGIVPLQYDSLNIGLSILWQLLFVIGLIMAGVNFLNGSGTRDLKQIVVYGVLGAIFFFAGIGLIRNTRDRPS